MKFRTELLPSPAHFHISYSDNLFFLGSCFSDAMAGKLSALKMNTLVNPTGVVYNPASVADTFIRLISGYHLESDDVFCQNGIWNSFSLHSSFASASAQELMDKANRAIDNSCQFLRSASCIFITLGTAWVYRLLESNRVVANCHKLPANQFQRFALSVPQVVGLLKPVVRSLSMNRPGVHIIFTVSPIRHWKDGAHANQLSKSTLLLAVDQLCALFPDVVSYFPAYELLLDDLRDYRFYADDLVHPSSAAVEYIFSYFQQVFMEPSTIEISHQVSSILAAAAHRPFNPDSDEYRSFCRTAMEQIKAVNAQIPSLDFSHEKTVFLSALNKVGQ